MWVHPDLNTPHELLIGIWHTTWRHAGKHKLLNYFFMLHSAHLALLASSFTTRTSYLRCFASPTNARSLHRHPQRERAKEHEGFTASGQDGGFATGRRELGFAVGEAGGVTLLPPRAEIQWPQYCASMTTDGESYDQERDHRSTWVDEWTLRGSAGEAIRGIVGRHGSMNGPFMALPAKLQVKHADTTSLLLVVEIKW
jgi:hypothetical protein